MKPKRRQPSFTHSFVTTEIRGVDHTARTITAYASTAAMDRHGTVVEPKAFKETIKAFIKNNPVVLAGHLHWYENAEPPTVGRVIEHKIDEKGLLVTIEFAKGGAADLYWERYSNGFQRGLSIGFRVMARERRPREDGTGEFEVYTKVELLEISLVAVPSNPETVVGRCLDGDIDPLDGCRERTLASIRDFIDGDGEEAADAELTREYLDTTRQNKERLATLVADVEAIRRAVRDLRADIDALLTRRQSQPPPPPPTQTTKTASALPGVL